MLRQLDLGPNGTFVDNYYSSFGMPYGDQPGLSAIVDVHLDPGRDLLELTGHTYAHAWYARSATKLGKDVGFAIDGTLRMVTVGAWAGTDQQALAVGVANLEAGDHNISLAIHSFGKGDAQVEATDFRKVATPGIDERARAFVPYVEGGAAIVFIGSTAALVALFLRHRRRRRVARLRA